MKRLILVRHGKSSWEYDLTDKLRPLLKRGITDGDLVSSHFKTLDYHIDFVYSSPANRAYSTCEIFLNTLKIPDEKVKKVESLYTFNDKEVVKFIKSVDNKLETIMIFGHNNAFNDVVNSLGSEHIDNLPTTGLAIIEFDTDKWENVKRGTTKELLTPKELKKS
ncbi:phosphohistidine phosphatase [Flavobacteriaceae bacterium MAR_2010_188]|nr:phosphohistidine phosphatase [Flavobacteriaceae bacterium MAR_2010_188]